MLSLQSSVSELPKFWAATFCPNPDFLSYERGYCHNSLLCIQCNYGMYNIAKNQLLSLNSIYFYLTTSELNYKEKSTILTKVEQKSGLFSRVFDHKMTNFYLVCKVLVMFGTAVLYRIQLAYIQGLP